MPTVRLEHANLTVSALERSIDFYGRALGFEVRWRGEILNTTRMAPAAHIGLPGADYYLALFEAEEDRGAPHSYAPPGINHFGFVVDDLVAARAQIEAAGAKIHYYGDYEPGRRAYFSDPDGIEIEVVEY